MWVFAYGSLLWDPGFAPVESIRADMAGYQRSFCMRSIHHRGTPDHPGLVLALDAADAACAGMALRVADDQADAVLAYLRERELISSAYLERHVPARLADGREIQALVYVIDRTHGQYCQLDLETQARVMATATGGRGPNHEYLSKTVGLLHDLGISDPELDWLQHRVSELREPV